MSVVTHAEITTEAERPTLLLEVQPEVADLLTGPSEAAPATWTAGHALLRLHLTEESLEELQTVIQHHLTIPVQAWVHVQPGLW